MDPTFYSCISWWSVPLSNQCNLSLTFTKILLLPRCFYREILAIYDTSFFDNNLYRRISLPSLFYHFPSSTLSSITDDFHRVQHALTAGNKWYCLFYLYWAFRYSSCVYGTNIIIIFFFFYRVYWILMMVSVRWLSSSLHPWNKDVYVKKQHSYKIYQDDVHS